MQLKLLPVHLFFCQPFFLFELPSLLVESLLLLLLLSLDLLFHLFELVVEIFVIHLELGHLLAVGLLHSSVVVAESLIVYQWVTVEVILVVTDQHSIAVLEL